MARWARNHSSVRSTPSSRSVHGFQPRWISAATRVERRALQLPRTRRRVVRLVLEVDRAGDRVVELLHARLDAGADVDDQPAAPVRRPEQRVDDVVDVHEVAGLLPVTEDRGPGPVEHHAREDRDDARLTVRVLAGAVDVRKREGAVLEAVDLPVVVEVVARRLLRHAVRRLRALRMTLPHRQVLGGAVKRPARRREDDLLGPGRERALADVQRPQDVDLGVEHRPGDRHADVGLRREVEDDVGLAVRDEVGDRRRPDVEAVERELAAAERAGVGQVRQRSGGEVVDDVDVPALGEQSVGKSRSDEAGTAGHERFHVVS